jgi:hypothetical protein
VSEISGRRLIGVGRIDRIAISRRNRQRRMPLGNGRTTGQKLTA